jgi:L-lactate dehydrogenase complex protein LldG
MSEDTARTEILARLRSALADVPSGETAHDVPVARDYVNAHLDGAPERVAEVLADRLTDYRARVHHSSEAELPALLARLLGEHGSRRVAVPAGLPDPWLGELGPGVERVPDVPSLTAADLDTVDSVVTGCAVAIAETGTLVLDTGPGQGRRLLTLVPDHHVCVVRPEQILASVPQAVAALAPRRPLTWISGPSATSDIELDRVEGVHGPRTLEVVLLGA